MIRLLPVAVALQCVAVCCCVLQSLASENRDLHDQAASSCSCVAVCCSVLRRITIFMIRFLSVAVVLQCFAVCGSLWQCVGVCCSHLLLRIAIFMIRLLPVAVVLQCVAVCCSVLQCVAENHDLHYQIHFCCSCVAVCGSVRQCVSVSCSVLQSLASENRDLHDQAASSCR